jgi:hypothetical protein
LSLMLAVNARNDLYLSSDGNLARNTDLDAIMQAAQHAAQTQLGEMIYATDAGVPNFDTVWSGSPNLSQFDAFLRRAILGVDGVQQILDLDVTLADNALRYRVVIQTVFGTAVLNG